MNEGRRADEIADEGLRPRGLDGLFGNAVGAWKRATAKRTERICPK